MPANHKGWHALRPIGQFSRDLLQNLLQIGVGEQCGGCREHSDSGSREEYIEEGIYHYENFVACHRSGDPEDGEHERRGWSEQKVMDRSGAYLPAGRAEEGSCRGHGDKGCDAV